MEEKRSDFLLKMEPIAKQAHGLVEEDSGNSLIIIATDKEKLSIVTTGSEEDIVRALVSFGLYEDTRGVFLKSVEFISKMIDASHTNND